MGADVLRTNIIAKLERSCFVSSAVLNAPTTPSPEPSDGGNGRATVQTSNFRLTKNGFTNTADKFL